MMSWKNLSKTLSDRMLEKYDHLEEFFKKSGISEHLTRETIRRFLYHDQKIEIPSLIIICKYLGYPPKEIKKIIKAAGDTVFHDLLGNGNG